MVVEWSLESLTLKERKAFIKIQQKELEQAVLTLLLEKNQRFSLKELKQNLQKDAVLDQVVESLVQKNYILRANRQYESQIPFLQERLTERLMERYALCVTSIVEELVELAPALLTLIKAQGASEVSAEEQFMFLMSRVLIEEKRKNPQVLAFAAGGTLAAQLQAFAFVFHEVEGARYTLINSGIPAVNEPDLLEFFVATDCDTYESQPKLAALYALVGDVSPEYAVQQFGNQLVQRKTGGHARTDIFAEFLQMSHWLKAEGQPNGVGFYDSADYEKLYSAFQQVVAPLLREPEGGKFPQFAYDYLRLELCQRLGFPKEMQRFCIIKASGKQ